MPINIGTSGVGRILVGTSAVEKVYAGTDLVWTNSGEVDQSLLSGFATAGLAYTGAVVVFYDMGDNATPDAFDIVSWQTPSAGESTLTIYTDATKTTEIVSSTATDDSLLNFFDPGGSTPQNGLTQTQITQLIGISTVDGLQNNVAGNRVYVIPITHTTLIQ